MKLSSLQFTIFLLLLVGCSRSDRPPLGKVSGTVTFGGQPLAAAAVVFMPVEGGRFSRGYTDAEGRYTLTYLRDVPGAKIGSHKVAVATATEESPEDVIPARYHSQTTLTADVTRGRNEINFELNR